MTSKQVHTFAIGDVHGRADFLEELLHEIARKTQRLTETYRVVFLGDIIDRGPESREIMDLVSKNLASVSHGVQMPMPTGDNRFHYFV